MAGNPGLDNGEWMMRAQRQALNPYNPYNGPNAQTPDPYLLAAWDKAMSQQQALNPYLTPRAWSNAQSGAPTPGEREAEDVTGLRMLEEFLAKRRRARDD